MKRHQWQNTRWLTAACLCILSYSTCLVGLAETPAGSRPELRWQLAYDDAGRITQLTDPGGRVTKISYELDDKQRVRRVVKALPDATQVSFEFDDFGRRVRMTDGAGSVRYEHDELGRLKAVRRDGQPTIAYAYDTLDRLGSMSVGEGAAVRYVYDFLGRLDSIETPVGKISYEYQMGQGMVIRTLPNGIRTRWKYNPDGGLEEITHVGKDKYVQLQFTYAYRPDGLINNIKEFSPQGERLSACEYDPVQRLSGIAGSNGEKISYRYDKFGNRTATVVDGQETQSCDYDWAGRMTKHNGQECIHDAAGNLTSYAGKDGERAFEFNAMNLLKSASFGDSKVEYQYDGDGNLITRKSDGKTTSFVPDPLADIWRPLLATDADGQRTLYVWEGDSPLATITGREVKFLLHDHLGSVRAIVDAQGKIIARFDYAPFGEPRGQPKDGGLNPGFAGLFYDPQGALYLTRVRGYDASLGRFLQPDPQQRIPFGSQKDLSLYAYCGGDPINFYDRDGATPEWVGAAWRYGTQFIIQIPRTAWEGIKGIADFYRPSNLAAGFRGGWVWGEPHPGTWAAQADQLGGPAWKGAVQFVLSQAVLTEIDIALGGLLPKTHIPLGNVGHVGVGEQAYFGAPHLGLVQRAGKAVLHLYGSKAYIHLGRFGFDLPYALPLLFQPEEAEAGVSTPMVPTLGRAKLSNRTQIEHELELPQRKDIFDPSWLRRPFFPPDDHGGGGGAVAGFGLLPLSGSGRATLDPSRVGGVYLGGAGGVLEHLRQLKGVVLDANNNVVLLAKDDEAIQLPPLRVDDVVTIFRSVYIHGEGPTVTIDPSPENPEGSAMIIRHSKATENTYVGWVLYQADRLMKGYTLGVDNKTQKDVQSAVPGYATVVDTIYFGGDDPEKLRKEGHWERFWIVPAAARRFEGNRRELTLLDVPLKVKTQTMKWEKGELVDDTNGKSSPGALAFTDWFTTNYDLVANEQYLTPPPESGLSNAVPVFSELRRIALVTAIAEKLRDQGVPLPFWMRDYEVRPVPFEKITPGLIVTRSNQRVRARVYGGVELSPENKNVKVFSATSDLAQLPETEKAVVREVVKLANSLEDTVRSRKTSPLPLALEPFTHQGIKYQAVAMPGAETLALAPCRLNEVDLAVPIEGGQAIQLARSYHSFFNPAGPWGRGWTMDLPRLEKIQVPVKREDNQAEYRVAYELITPLNRVYARFSNIQTVPSLNNSQLQVPDNKCEFYGLADAKPEFLSHPTRELILKDGSSWHFSESGELVMSEQNGFRTVYERDNQGRVTRIVGLVGKQPRAFIRLQYNAAGRLESAEGEIAQGKQTVRYQYGSDGKLANVVSQSGTLGYQYQGPWVSTVTSRPFDSAGKQQPEVVLCRFTYNAQGQLLSETSGDKSKVEYQVIADAQGHKVVASRSGDSSATEFIRYDAAYHPVEAQYADGMRASWEYPPQGGAVLKLSGTEGGITKLTQSADQRRRTLELPDGYKAIAEYDDAGRLLSLSQNGRTVVRKQWYPDGKLRAAETETSALHPQYNDDGLVASVILTPPGTGERAERWQEIQLDPAVRPVEITDYSGLHVLASYDARGELASAIMKRDAKNYGFDITRDKSGRIESVKSSWGEEHYTYDDGGTLATIEVEKQGEKAVAEYKSGLLQRIKQLDGGETRIAYYEDTIRQGLPKEIRTANDLLLTYEYGSENRLANINCGDAYKLEFTYDGQGRLIDLAQVALQK